MTKLNSMRFRIGDILAVALVLILAGAVAVCFLPKDSAIPVQAEVYQDGSLIKTHSLDTDLSFEITGT